MKRMITLIITALFSVFAGVGFILPKEDDFYFNSKGNMEAYYQTSSADEDIQYKQLFQSVRGYQADQKEKCDTTRRQEPRPEWVEVSTHSKGFPAGVWDPVYVKEGSATVKGSGSTVTYTLEGPANVCAPVAGIINTSHYACDYGKYMEFVSTLADGTKITTTIKNARCWYCCMNKTPPADGRYTATTPTSMKGQSMRTGDILVAGQAGTTVTLHYSTDNKLNVID